MKSYMILSKVILIFCVLGIIATVINAFTGIINTSITAGGSIICIMGFVISGNAIISLEQQRKEKKREEVSRSVD